MEGTARSEKLGDIMGGDDDQKSFGAPRAEGPAADTMSTAGGKKKSLVAPRHRGEGDIMGGKDDQKSSGAPRAEGPEADTLVAPRHRGDGEIMKYCQTSISHPSEFSNGEKGMRQPGISEGTGGNRLVSETADTMSAAGGKNKSFVAPRHRGDVGETFEYLEGVCNIALTVIKYVVLKKKNYIII